MHIINEVLKDLRDYNLPRDIDKAFDKIKCPIQHGLRVGWYYQEDLDYFNEWRGRNENIRVNPPFEGMLVAINDVEARGFDSDLEPDQCIVIMHSYPVEKCYCAYTWIALNRLLDDDSLIEIFELDKEK